MTTVRSQAFDHGKSTEMLETDEPNLQVARFPKNATCAVTTSWDDNDDANMEILRILDSMGLKGTFYVDPGNPGARWAVGNGLTESQLRKLAKDNEVGSHTWSHRNLRQCDANVLREELTRSKEYIQSITKCPVLGLAYPWGEHSLTVQRAVQECGYLFARTVDEGSTTFPPLSPYVWGVSVQALARPRLLSRKAHIYVKNLASDWCKLALKLFERARRTTGVWHLFGHASEILRKPGLKDDLLQVFRYVACREDVWYTTNGMLFLNEMVRRGVRISRSRHDGNLVFRVEARFSPETLPYEIQVPLRLVVPADWADGFNVEVTAAGSGRFAMGRAMGQTWIDLFGSGVKIEVVREQSV